MEAGSAAPGGGRWQAAVVLLAALLAYANSFPGAFFPDDELIVLRNPLVASLDLRAILTTDYWGRDANSGLHRPLTTLSLGLNRLLLGETAAAFHAVNVLLHALVALALLRLLRGWGVPPGRSLFAAALFAVHPIHAESVNTVVGRAELLAALFFLLALRWSQSARPRTLALSALAYAAALLSKEHAVTFLAAVPLTDAFFRRPLRSRLPFYGGLALLTLGWLLLRRYGVDHGGVPPDVFDRSYTPLAFLPPAARILTALGIQLHYLAHLAVPISLEGVYSGSRLADPLRGIDTAAGLATVAAVAGLALLALRLRGRLSGLAILLYVVCFAATANIAFVTVVSMADRLAYLPAAWFCVFVAALPPPRRDPRWRRAGAAAAAAIVALFAVGTALRNAEFSSPARLWAAGFARDRGNILAGLYLAGALERNGSLPEADEIHRRVEEVDPDFFENNVAHARLLLRLGRPAEAREIADRAAREGFSPPLAAILVEANLRLERPREALAWLDRTPDRYQAYGTYWRMRGRALAQLGDARGSREAFARAADVEAEHQPAPAGAGSTAGAAAPAVR